KVKVHRGHHKQALRILKHVDTTNKMVLTKKEIIIMGHSAGGSIASIAGLLMKGYMSLWESYFVFTEGQNKSMNKAGKDYYDNNVNSLRIVNANDPVPCVPFKCFGYRHTKNVINIGKKRKWWRVIVLFGRWKKNMVDHSPQDYVENLEKYYAEKDN
ncbi:MAG: lipase family protein, partial [Gammaproteobacteria bacterium]|nr:lipase family protein [Gammaproteobacteria bacterium]